MMQMNSFELPLVIPLSMHMTGCLQLVFSFSSPTESQLAKLHPPVRRGLRRCFDSVHPHRHNKLSVVLQEAMPRVSLLETRLFLGKASGADSFPGIVYRLYAKMFSNVINFIIY